jgi:nucleoside-diphosphate-sugar epimerase
VRVLIIGCGYVGVALGAELARQGHEVLGLRRGSSGAEELQSCGITPLVGDVTNPATLPKLTAPFDWVVNAISSSKGGLPEYRAIYLEGTRHVMEWLAEVGRASPSAPPLAKYVFISSTSVYAQTDRSIVTEQSAAAGASETSKVLVETESLLLQIAREGRFPAVILRPSGIYGPGRGHLFHQFLRGEATIAGTGERYLNMIHRDDLAGAIIAALQRGQSGEIYNVTDDEPVTQLEFFRWLSERLNKPLPPVRSEGEPSSRKRGFTNKRVSNQKLKSELGYLLKFPTYREGYTSEIRRIVDS